MSEVDLQRAVRVATELPAACAAVGEVYRRLQVEIDRRRPVCVASGKCCHFEAYGHRLYVTTLELALFKREFGGGEMPAIGKGCPLQKGGLCGVHAIRPFGCRIFFCDPTAGQWQQEQYELFHVELKRLHERFEVPYHYVEWRYALAAVFHGGE